MSTKSGSRHKSTVSVTSMPPCALQLPDTLSVRARPVPDAGVLVLADSDPGIVQKSRSRGVWQCAGLFAQRLCLITKRLMAHKHFIEGLCSEKPCISPWRLCDY